MKVPDVAAKTFSSEKITDTFKATFSTFDTPVFSISVLKQPMNGLRIEKLLNKK